MSRRNDDDYIIDARDGHGAGNGNNSNQSLIKKYLMFGAATTVAAGVGAYAFVRMRVCRPEQYMVKTGPMIKDMHVAKQGILWPFQKGEMINMNPTTHEFKLHAMSREKVELMLPVVFTVAPIDPMIDMDGFKSYARKLHGMSDSGVRDTIGAMVEGETRTLTAKMSIEDMFSRKDIFREEVVDKISADLEQLGLKVINANIKEMADFDEKNKYFEYRKKRAIETANYEAQVDVAEARKQGEIGVKERDGTIRIETARIERDAKLEENEREKAVAVSNAELQKVQAESERVAEIARIEAEMAAKEREIELQKHVESRRREQQLESRRADELSTAIAKAEAMERLADATLYQKQKEAEGVRTYLEAQADGLHNLTTATNGDHNLAQFYLALNSNLYPTLAEKQAEAIRGLSPKVQIWNTGNGEANNDFTTPFTRLVQSFAPTLEGMKDHVRVPGLTVNSKSETKKD